jgi:shikimate kinase / 3-dehydroquinate synthase
MTPRRIVLIGFSGSGKSTVGRSVAERIGWQLVDMDAEIERREGRSIPDIFRDSGEGAFRAIEREVFREALNTERAVVSTGGGAVVGDEVWTEEWLGAPGTLTVLLDAPAAELHARLVAQQAADATGATRPMLEGDDPLGRIEALKAQRAPWYRRAQATIPVAGRSPRELGAVIASLGNADAPAEIVLSVPGGNSTVRVGSGVLAELGGLPHVWPRARRVWVVADERVAAHHLETAVAALAASGLEVRTLTFPAGEASKSMSGLSAILDGLLEGGIERSDVIVALGGGVAGDLVGFAAATVLRGVGLVQVPTTLLAMVDSSVGGKTGINHATGKNRIGAFYQPPLVLIDPTLLDTLPDREYRSGWAEIVKHSLIEPSTPAGDSGLAALIAANAAALRDRTSPLLPGVIARNVAIKASVVEADEREAGLRGILNFGHTIGHAIEAAGYELLHGEAIAVGLHGAMRLGVELGRVGEDEVERVVATLREFGLPTEVGADLETVRHLMRGDKKRVSGEQQWILPNPDGGVEIVRGVPDVAVDAALGAVVRP